MKQPNLKTLQQRVDNWNAKYPVGTPVVRYRLINPLCDAENTKTRSAAWVMCGHSAVVMVESIAGGVALESVMPVNAI